MVSTGDKQPLTPSEGGDQPATGLVSRTRRSLSAVLGERVHKPSSKNRQKNSDLQGWQNPSFEMTEVELHKDSKTADKMGEEESVEKGSRVEKTSRHSSKGRRKHREHRKKPDVLVEEHELEERPSKQPEKEVLRAHRECESDR